MGDPATAGPVPDEPLAHRSQMSPVGAPTRQEDVRPWWKSEPIDQSRIVRLEITERGGHGSAPVKPGDAGAPAPVRVRPAWRAVAVPSEHGGWGLTLEPVLLGLLVAFSAAGLAIGLAAMLAFLLRTPLKVALVDHRRHRTLPRTRLAWQIAVGEVGLVLVLAGIAVVAAGWTWLIPLAVAAPMFAVELWFDIRSRSRRLVPELSGAVGITAVAAAIVVAGGERTPLAIAGWLILAARAVASIPFVRTQIARLRHPDTSTTTSDTFQAAAVVIAIVAALVDLDVVIGAAAVALLVAAQWTWVRRPVPPPKDLGLCQMVAGLAVVAATATGVLTLA